MSLNFNSQFIPARSSLRHSQDDLYIRGPILLAKVQVDPLTTKLASEFIGKTWRLATVGKDDLVQGARFENALWRLWRQEMLGLKRTSTSGIDRDQLDQSSITLLVPLVVSHETCHTRNELLFVSSIESNTPNQAGYAQLSSRQLTQFYDDSMGSPLTRPCLKRSRTSDRSDSPLSFRTAVSGSSDEYPRRHVMFNSCVVQGLIIDTLNSNTSTDDFESLDFDSENESLESSVSDLDCPSPIPIPRCRTLKQDDFVIIQALPPAELFPPPKQEERETKIIFVPPPGMADLEEDALCRIDKLPPALKKTASSRNLLQEKQDLDYENALEEIGHAKKRRAIQHPSGGDNDEDEETLVIRRRKRHSKSFSGVTEDDASFADIVSFSMEAGRYSALPTSNHLLDELGVQVATNDTVDMEEEYVSGREFDDTAKHVEIGLVGGYYNFAIETTCQIVAAVKGFLFLREDLEVETPL